MFYFFSKVERPTNMNYKLQLMDHATILYVPVKLNKAHGKGAFIQCAW